MKRWTRQAQHAHASNPDTKLAYISSSSKPDNLQGEKIPIETKMSAKQGKKQMKEEKIQMKKKTRSG